MHFSDTGASTTTNPSANVIASTSYSEPWDTSNDTAVPNNGWISGEGTLPFNYDESSQLLSVGYMPPTDVVLNSWTINLTNPAGGSIADVVLDGAPDPSGNFKVKIADNLLVKTLQNNAATLSGNQSISWDGKDTGGNYVADGDYIYYIYAGPNIVKKSGVIHVQRAAEITAASLSEPYISPNGDGIKDSTMITYILSEPAAVSLAVISSEVSTIRSMPAPGNQGPNSAVWDGRDNLGAVVEDGNYILRLTSTYASGAQRTKDFNVVVDDNSLTAPAEPANKVVSSAIEPAYSPDGSKLAYAKDVAGKKQIFALDLLTTNSLQLTTIGNNLQPNWSPDGSTITYTSDRGGNNNLWLMKTDGSAQKQVSAASASETSPAFSPDGLSLAYASNRTGELGINKWNLWLVGSDGRNPVQLTKDKNT